MALAAIVFVLNGASAQWRAELNRRLCFLWLVIADCVGATAGLVLGVGLALANGDVFALVWQQITTAGVGLAIVAISSRRLPGLPNRRATIRSHARFGILLTLVQVQNFVSSNTDKVALGLSAGTSGLGLYSRAYQVFSLPMVQVLAPLTRVALPFLARAHRAGSLAAITSNLFRIVGYPFVIGYAWLAASASAVVPVLLGDQWVGSSGVLAVLSVGGVFQALGFVFYWAALAAGKTRTLFLCELVGRAPMVVGMILSRRHMAQCWLHLCIRAAF